MIFKTRKDAEEAGCAAVWDAHMGCGSLPPADRSKLASAAGRGVKPPKPGDGMNKLERAFHGKAVAAFGVGNVYFEPFKLRLAGRTWYTLDFLIDDGYPMFLYEIKGFMRDDAAIKLKVAADTYPCFTFVLVTRPKGVWVCREVTRTGISRQTFCPEWLR